MTKLPFWIITAVAATVAGCTLDSETVSQSREGDICYAWAVARAGNSDPKNGVIAFEELKRRGDLPVSDLIAIRDGLAPRPGMTEKGAICAWGGMYDAVNTTTTAYGIERQYVSRSEYRNTYYFYTRNGIVHTVQN